jgi:hypothetical protein
MKYSVGDSVEITDNNSGHQYPDGTVLTILSVYEDGYEGTPDSSGVQWRFGDSECRGLGPDLFKPWGKTQRYEGLTITVTEKLDGTNSCIIIKDSKVAGVQSRNRMIKVGDDNFGFAYWVENNKEDLVSLGDGYHYGEWYGEGIQKNPHKIKGKRFALFNTSRPQETLPACVELVPVLYTGRYLGQSHLDKTMRHLVTTSMVTGYKPEGVIIYFHQHRQSLKYTFNSNKAKWELT